MINSRFSKFLIVHLVLSLFVVVPAIGQDAIRHSLFIAGPNFTGILDEDGKVQWNAGRLAARDGFVLDNGNVLIAWNDEVKEFNRAEQDKIVFHYRKSATNKEIGTVERLANGNTLITELGVEPRLIEVAADEGVDYTIEFIGTRKGFDSRSKEQVDKERITHQVLH